MVAQLGRNIAPLHVAAPQYLLLRFLEGCSNEALGSVMTPATESLSYSNQLRLSRSCLSNTQGVLQFRRSTLWY